MKKEYHYFFNEDEDKQGKIVKFLDKNEVKYNMVSDCISLKIFNDNPCFTRIYDFGA